MTVPSHVPPVVTDGIQVAAFTEGITNPNATTNGEEGAVTTPVVSADTPVSETRFTKADLENARKQEKDKLYSRLDSLASEVETLRKEREARAAEEAAKQAEIQAERDRLAQEEMTVKELLAAKEQEFNERLDAERRAREESLALLEAERKFNELQAYKQQAIASASDSIIPDLIDMVQGNTVEEINASITTLQERSARILDGVAQAAQAQRQAMRTVSPTGAAPVGPMENNPNYETLSAQDIASMDMQTYAKNRDRLMQAASRRDRGLFG